MLREDEFELLVALQAAGEVPCTVDGGSCCASAAGAGTDIASEYVGLIDCLKDKGFIEGSTGGLHMTRAGLEALEPYRVRRAILLAAGFGSRLMPVTLETPKPLVRVRGKRIVDTIIDALHAAGVDEIYLVRGYLGERFDQLLEAYPDIHFIDNPLFDSTNNISSAVAAREYFQNAYVFESDLLLRNAALITRYQYASNYLGVSVDKTSDWCFTVEDGYIIDLKKGGTGCHHMFGVSYWTAEDGLKLAEDLPRVFAREDGRDIFWDDVPVVRCPQDFSIRIRECGFEDITEIDTFEELQELDPSYR